MANGDESKAPRTTRRRVAPAPDPRDESLNAREARESAQNRGRIRGLEGQLARLEEDERKALGNAPPGSARAGVEEHFAARRRNLAAELDTLRGGTAEDEG